MLYKMSYKGRNVIGFNRFVRPTKKIFPFELKPKHRKIQECERRLTEILQPSQMILTSNIKNKFEPFGTPEKAQKLIDEVKDHYTIKYINEPILLNHILAELSSVEIIQITV